MKVDLRHMRADDGPAVLAVYGEGIATGDATFEDKVPEWQDWNASHLESCRIVAERRGRVVGWAALSPTSARKVYAGVAEVSIYVAASERGTAVGKRLMGALVEASEAAGLWTLQASVFPENTVSICLHQKFGFRVLGRRERIARMNHGPLAGQWRDVLLLERRSPVVSCE